MAPEIPEDLYCLIKKAVSGAALAPPLLCTRARTARGSRGSRGRQWRPQTQGQVPAQTACSHSGLRPTCPAASHRTAVVRGGQCASAIQFICGHPQRSI